MRIRAAAAEDKSESSVIEELELDEPRNNVVLVKLVDASGSTSTERVAIDPARGVNVEIILTVDGTQSALVVGAHLALTPCPPPLPGEATLSSTGPVAAAAPSDLETMERAMIEKALKEARFNKTQAAKVLGLTRAQLYVRLKRHGIEYK